jgi:hypothetical protein
LWAISALPQEQEALLQQMTPKLQQTWDRKEDHWHDILAAQMRFPATMPDTIREMWQKNQVIATTNQATLSLVEFAYMFVDQNFSNLSL